MFNHPRIQSLIDQGAIFLVNTSGGKDSQAMSNLLLATVPHDQLLFVHAHLGKVEWPGVIEHIERTVPLPVHVVSAQKSFFDMVERRQMWPSPQQRQCTSDLKRGPIMKFMRHHSNATGKTLYVNCLGLRAEESPGRKKHPVLSLVRKECNSKRVVLEWLPIHEYTLSDVWASEGHTIEDIARRVALWKAGLKEQAVEGFAFHWAYAAGMRRLSCSFCIMASREDLTTAAGLRPDLLTEYVALERKIGHTFLMPKKGEPPRFLDEVLGIEVRILNAAGLNGSDRVPGYHQLDLWR